MESIRDITEANRCIRELAALSLLPSIWSGGQPEQISDNLADALQSSLRAEAVWVRCRAADGALEKKPAIRLKRIGRSEDVIASFEAAVETALRREGEEISSAILAGHKVKLAVMTLGIDSEFGVIAIGSTREDFPTATERILLNVAVNQAIIAFKSAKQLNTLRRSENNLRDFFENATLGLHWVDANGIIVWANRRELEMLGYSKDEYVGQSITKFHADGCVIEDILARLTRGETLREYEAKLRCKDGSVRTVLIDSSVLFEKGQFIHTRCFTRDITERKEAEQKASEAAEQRRLAFEAAEVGSWDYRFDEGRIVWDERCRAMWGLANGADLSYEAVMERVHPDDREKAVNALQRALRGESNGRYDVDFRVVWPDGSQRWIASKGQVYFSTAGERQPTRFVGIARDFTRERHAQEAIETSERELRALADSIPQLAWTANADGYRVWFNKRWFEYTGKTLAECQGWGWQSVHHPEMLQKVLKAWNTSIELGKPFEMEFPLRAADGTFRWFLTQVNPVRDSIGRVIRWFGTNTDVDEVKRAQDALKAAQDELRKHADRLEEQVEQRTAQLKETIQELEAFSYSVSHDMRSPLRAMQGYSDALLAEYSDKVGETGAEYLRRIRRSASRMDLLIQDVLAYSRVAKGEINLKVVSVENVICDVIQNYPSLQPDQADVLVNSPIPEIIGHEAYLTQIVSNLLTNAVKFVGPGIKPVVTIRNRVEGDMVRIEFTDNGIGIAPKHQKQIFQIFGRVYPEKKYEGTGIGLAIAKKAAERMGGCVGVESEAGSGSTFFVVLKRAA
jgi:PAS domain S-box-containing protein